MKNLLVYAFVNARVRAMLGNLFGVAGLTSLANARDLVEAGALLKNSPYASLIKKDLKTAADIADLEKDLARYDIAVYEKIVRSLSGDPAGVVALLWERYRLDELKLAVRAAGQRGGWSQAYDVLARFDGVVYKKAAAVALQYHRSGSLFYLEAALDRAYFARLKAQIDRLTGTDRRVAARFLGYAIDRENILRLLRLKLYFNLSDAEAVRQILPGGFKVDAALAGFAMAGNDPAAVVKTLALGPYRALSQAPAQPPRALLQFVEVALHRVMLDEALRILRGYPFTIGTVLAYLFLKRAETSNIITLLYGKLYGLDSAVIKEEILC